MESALFLIAIALGFKLALDSHQSAQPSLRLAGIILGILISTLAAFQLATACLSGSCGKSGQAMGSKMCAMEHGMPGMGGGMMKKMGSPHGMSGNMAGFQHPPMDGMSAGQALPEGHPPVSQDQK